jgi:hypothetical protein
MHFLATPPTVIARWLGWFLASCLLVASARAEDAATPPGKDEFSKLVTLAPFVVNGKSLAISIYARTRSDRRYGEDFSGEVAKVVYEAVTENTGKGLVIIGAKGEPHPALVFRKFLALAQDGKLDPEIAARGPELSALIERWQRSFNDGKSDDGDKGRGKASAKDDDDFDFDFDKLFTALPMPLQGVGAKLYQLAWEEKFDDAKVEAKLRALRPGDLERRERFTSFDWVFYLPPKGAFDKVLDEIIAEALKKEEMGFFARTAVKGVLLVMKPKIRRVIEAARQGMMLAAVVQAQTNYTEAETDALIGAYVEVFIPFDDKAKKIPGKNDHERAVYAVREQLRKNAEKAKKSAEPEPVVAEAAKSDAAN